MTRKKIVILGSTGSIGKNTLDVLRGMQETYEVYGLAAHKSVRELLAQAAEFRPARLALTDAAASREAAEGFAGELLAGPQALCDICEGADLVVLSVVGMAGLPPFVHCLRRGIPVALATKEAMVYGGRLARDLMDATGTPVLPLDSEISAIFQCLQGNKKAQVAEILLTASGGPFRTWPLERVRQATLAEALKHPNWSMGAKITIDSASMANKGLEIMETRWMFDIAPEKITVVVHPESIVHSAVRYLDGSVMAQMGATDMRLPIAYALQYPDRLPNCARALDLFAVGTLHFEQPDYAKFPCLRLARKQSQRARPCRWSLMPPTMRRSRSSGAAQSDFGRSARSSGRRWTASAARKSRALRKSMRATRRIRSFAETVAQRFAVQP
ncbi:MAG: 1-deoxy-D-xylulose-5-phosphate reductoisomerase [Christensenellaceae bacterium]